MTLTTVSLVLAGANLVLLLVILFRKGKNESIGSDLARLDERMQNLAASADKTAQAVRDEARQNREELFQALKNASDSSSKSIVDLTRLNEQKLENIRQSVEGNLLKIQEENSRKLEQMRATVDEKLQSTLEKRIGESFTQVSERLESVHKGLGEMQKLASEVGNLKNVLSNIKTRGILGEIQLEKILEQILTREQYEKDVNIVGNNKVEFAIKLPGKDDGPVFLPIDSKLPLTEYEKLLAAQELADKDLVKSCGDALEVSIKLQAKAINKYISPPKTTDFAIMFLPIEGLYAEVLRRPELFHSLISQYKIVITGPTTFAAFLNSLQMGFKTLAVEKRATEVWKLLAAVKSGMDDFLKNLTTTKGHLDDAYSSIEKAVKRTSIIDRKLKDVQALPVPEAEAMLEGEDPPEDKPNS